MVLGVVIGKLIWLIIVDVAERAQIVVIRVGKVGGEGVVGRKVAVATGTIVVHR